MSRDYSLLRRQNPIPVYLQRHGVRMHNGKFSCVNPGHDDRNPSASIFDNDEKWRCHACDLSGDVIDLVMLHRGLDHAGAVSYLGGDEWQATPQPPPQKGSKPKLVRDFGPPGEDVSRLKAGKVQLMSKGLRPYTKGIDHLYEYRDRDGILQAYVGRVDATDEHGKEIFPVRFHLVHKAWMQAGFQKGERRPLFGEHELANRPGDEVLLLEGEKCVRFAQALFPHMVCVSWIGGKGQVQDADFSALKGRHLTLWRDNDEEGAAAMNVAARKAEAATVLAVPIDKSWREGWDIVDVMATPGAAEAALQARVPYKFDASPKGKSGTWVRVTDGGWVPDDIHLIPSPSGQVKHTSSSNAFVALSYHPLFKTLGWDSMAKRIVWNGRPLDLGSLHYLHLHLNEATGLEINAGFDALVESVAVTRPLNRLADTVRQTVWDGVARVDALNTYLGVAFSPWAVAGLKRWFLGHVARILVPGTKQDLILILEGEQGIGKSTALKTLGEAFGYPGYARLASLGSGKMNDNDMQVIAGQTLIELGEMTAHRKADLDHFKDVTTRDTDKYRAPYTKDWLTVPRTASFAGTTNLTADYLSDPTGGRRFVPMLCERELDLSGLASDREMLYAEAATLIATGEPTYFTPAEEELQDSEVDKRQVVSYFKARMTELVEATSADFLAESHVWDHLGAGTASMRERKQALPDIKTAMLELGWHYGRRREGDDHRTWGFTLKPRARGRPQYKRQLFPRV
ncbi:MAG: VapE domain-containing protein [Hyphomicrobiaceae bacterium]